MRINTICNLPKQESTQDHQPKRVDQRSGGKNQLSNQQDKHVDDRAQPNPKHAIDQKSSNKAQDHIWPRVDRVQPHKLRGREVQIRLELVLQGTRIVVAKVRSCKTIKKTRYSYSVTCLPDRLLTKPDQTHEDQRHEAVRGGTRIAARTRATSGRLAQLVIVTPVQNPLSCGCDHRSRSFAVRFRRVQDRPPRFIFLVRSGHHLRLITARASYFLTKFTRSEGG